MKSDGLIKISNKFQRYDFNYGTKNGELLAFWSKNHKIANFWCKSFEKF